MIITILTSVLLTVATTTQETQVIDKLKSINGESIYVCGTKLSKQHTEIYYRNIVKIIFRNDDNINDFDVLAILLQESGLDYCAFGVRPRQYANKKNILRKKRKTISYSKKEIIKAMEDIPFKKFDLGLCQLLVNPYLTQYGTLNDIMSFPKGLNICINEMINRTKQYKVKHPWQVWNGIYFTKYTKNIKRQLWRLRK